VTTATSPVHPPASLTLLRPAMNQTAYMKVGILGFAASGKTFTAARLALGLAKEIGKGRPVAFFDTETGSDFVLPQFREAGIPLLVAKTRAFADLLTFMKEAEEHCSVAIIDSISHVWSELLEAFTKKLRRSNGLLFQDWGVVKPEWARFTDRFLNSQLHVILCGRAAYEWDFEENEAGKRELVKVGTKMRAETEMSYEPSLLLEMVRIKKAEITGDSNARGWVHRCYVLKDRNDVMDGAEIDDPTYESFRPILDRLAIGAQHVGVDTTRNSQALFDSPEDSIYKRKQMVEITLEEIQAAFVEAGKDGQSQDAKKARIETLKRIFGTPSWTAVTNMKLEQLRAGLRALRAEFGFAEPAENPPPSEGAHAEPPAPAGSDESADAVSDGGAQQQPGAAAPAPGGVITPAQAKAVWLAMEAKKLHADRRMQIIEAVGGTNTADIPADRLEDVLHAIKDAK
jgi:hypothetical protein